MLSQCGSCSVFPVMRIYGFNSDILLKTESSEDVLPFFMEAEQGLYGEKEPYVYVF